MSHQSVVVNLLDRSRISLSQTADLLRQFSPYLGVGLLFLLLAVQFLPSRNKAPIVNPKKWSEWSWERAKRDFTFGSKAMISQVFMATRTQSCQMYTNQGMVTVLGPKYINEIRNEERLNFEEHAHRAFHGSTPGFVAFDQRQGMTWFLSQIAQKHLTAYLNKMTVPMSEECNVTLKRYLGDSREWHTIHPLEEMSRIIAKMSSKIFLGEEFCRDEHWLKASRDYAFNAFTAQELLSLWPSYLTPIVHWFLPHCKQLRRDLATCRSIIEGVVKQRKAEKIALEKEGKTAERFEDTLEWMQKVSQGKDYDPTSVQLSLTMAAIHTTTDLTTWLLLCIAQHPEIIQPLRDEMISVLKAEGWRKTALYNLKLLDSVMKESQRLKPNVLGKTILSPSA